MKHRRSAIILCEEKGIRCIAVRYPMLKRRAGEEAGHDGGEELAGEDQESGRPEDEEGLRLFVIGA